MRLRDLPLALSVGQLLVVCSDPELLIVRARTDDITGNGAAVESLPVSVVEMCEPDSDCSLFCWRPLSSRRDRKLRRENASSDGHTFQVVRAAMKMPSLPLICFPPSSL